LRASSACPQSSGPSARWTIRRLRNRRRQKPRGVPDFSDSDANPAMRPITDDPKLPRVLLIGDSISIGYTLEVRKLLAGKANVHRNPGNGGPTINGLARLDEWLGTSRWDVIHFNWGLHDLKVLTNGQHQVELAQYERIFVNWSTN
jgi:acyl-CoA thioesterase-1